MLGVLAKLTEAIELLHVQLVTSSVLTHLLEYEIEVLLSQASRAGLDDLVSLGSQLCLCKAPEVLKQLGSESILLEEKP